MTGGLLGGRGGVSLSLFASGIGLSVTCGGSAMIVTTAVLGFELWMSDVAFE